MRFTSIYNVFRITRFAAIEVTQHGDQHVYHLFVVRKKGNTLENVIFDTFTNLDDCLAKTPKNTALYLVFNDEQVLTKIVSSIKDEGPGIVNKAFPNLRLEDFYYEVAPSEENTIVSICRRVIIEAVLARLHQKKVLISRFSLGITSLNNLTPYLDDEEVQLDKKNIILQNHEITGIEIRNNPKNISYDINGLHIADTFLLAFSEILKNISGSTNSFSNFKEKYLELSNNFKHHYFFNTFLKSALIFLLFLFFVNFLSFNYYFSKLEKLQTTNTMFTMDKTKLKFLDSLVAEKQRLVENILSNPYSKSSWYLDQFASQIPNSITLDNLIYQPLQHSIKENQKILVNEKNMIVSGQAKDSAIFLEWVDSLDSYEWIERAEVENYGLDSRNLMVFNLHLYLKHE